MRAYANSAKKLKARQETLYNPYREHFGWPLPPDKHYVTLSALCASEDGSLLETSELGQALSTGFATPEQFHGVDFDGSIVEANRRAVPKAHFHEDYLYEFIAGAKREGWLNPGLVNYDSLFMPEKGAYYATELMALLSDYNNLIFTCNFILRVHAKKTTIEEAIKAIQAAPNYERAVRSGWKMHANKGNGGKGYTYDGTRSNRTGMGSVVFYLKRP